MRILIRQCLIAIPFLCLAPVARAQSEFPRSADVASIEAIVAAAYESLAREPGQPFQWERFRSLYIPDARLIPNIEQTGGEFRVMSVEDFIAWVNVWYAENAPIGSTEDKGFVEEQIAAEIDRYGDVAHVFSTYQRHLWGSDEILGRGINSMQLVHNGGRWWISGVVWDEENGAGPIPAEYLP